VRNGSSQSRYRAQIRQLEKENQTLKLEIEAVKKDNKKMELENARLKRDTNNKMLQEINRNIAKLAPQAEIENRKKAEPVKKVVARRSEPFKKANVKEKRISVPDLSKSSSSEEEEEPQWIRKANSNNKENKTARRSHPSSMETDVVLNDMKREIVNSDGSKDIWYPNGNLKKISPDGLLIRMLYFNKDIKETNVNEGTVKYYYADTNTWHTTYIDGLEILEYPE